MSASYAIYNSPSGLRFGLTDRGGTWHETPAVPASRLTETGTRAGWHHVVGTYDGVNLKLYFDEDQVRTTTAVGTIKYDLSNQNDLYFGTYTSPTCALGYTGAIDEIRIYKEAITDSDVATRLAGGEIYDADQDGSMDAIDKCSSTPTNEVANARGCSVSQCCPNSGSRAIDDGGCPKVGEHGDWRNHGAYVSCVSSFAEQLEDEGLISGKQAGEMTRMAAWSSIGK